MSPADKPRCGSWWLLRERVSEIRACLQPCSLVALAESSERDTPDAPLGRKGETLHQQTGAGILDSCPHLSEDTQGQGTQVEATLR